MFVIMVTIITSWLRCRNERGHRLKKPAVPVSRKQEVLWKSLTVCTPSGSTTSKHHTTEWRDHPFRWTATGSLHIKPS